MCEGADLAKKTVRSDETSGFRPVMDLVFNLFIHKPFTGVLI